MVEMMVALALFALIGTAGFSMLDQVLRSQTRSEGRLDQLGQMQRALYLISADFAMAAPRSLDASATPAVRLARTDGFRLGYAVIDGDLRRSLVDSAGQSGREQTLISGVVAADWRFFDRRSGWGPRWPAGAVLPGSGLPENPEAVDLTLTLSNGSRLRRVALLPQGG